MGHLTLVMPLTSRVEQKVNMIDFSLFGKRYQFKLTEKHKPTVSPDERICFGILELWQHTRPHSLPLYFPSNRASLARLRRIPSEHIEPRADDERDAD